MGLLENEIIKNDRNWLLQPFQNMCCSSRNKDENKRKTNKISLNIKDNLLKNTTSQFLRIYKICSLKILAISISRMELFYYYLFTKKIKELMQINEYQNYINLFSSLQKHTYIHIIIICTFMEECEKKNKFIPRNQFLFANGIVIWKILSFFFLELLSGDTWRFLSG